MYISTFKPLREKLLNEVSISSLVKPSYTSFFDSAIVSVAAFVLDVSVENFKGDYFDLGYLGSAESQPIKLAAAILDQNSTDRFLVEMNSFREIPDHPIAYWITKGIRQAFVENPPLSNISTVAVGLQTGNNNRFLRRWYEVSIDGVGFNILSREDSAHSKKKWFPYNKGGDYRKWYGNQEYLVNWGSDGKEISDFKPRAVIRNPRFYFQPSISWSFISSSYFGVRVYPQGFVFDVAGSSIFPSKNEQFLELAGFLCSCVAPLLMKVMNPTVNFQAGNVELLPVKQVNVSVIAEKCIDISKADWDSNETSWDFQSNELVGYSNSSLLGASWGLHERRLQGRIAELISLEELNNQICIDAYGLQSDLSPKVLEEQITLSRADREKDCQRLISYAIGCMMGRYSLDEPGLIYAHAGNVSFEPGRYATFPADADGIVPITDELWFADDAPSRIRELLRAVWGPDTLEENMAWLAESLGTKASETPDETIRRYIADKFFKDHLQTYKKRPIYWLFSSGKQGAFQALVYLHRYHEGTLARLRAEYVVPLTGKIQSRIEMLQKDAAAASSTAARNKLAKEVEKLKKKHVELLAYDEQLRHYADMRITLDLDDGVKVNYGRFGDLLADVKAVTGGVGDE